jgi:hypothetical protein
MSLLIVRFLQLRTGGLLAWDISRAGVSSLDGKRNPVLLSQNLAPLKNSLGLDGVLNVVEGDKSVSPARSRLVVHNELCGEPALELGQLVCQKLLEVSQGEVVAEVEDADGLVWL